MPRGVRPTLENACYHINTRGNQKQTVFRIASDYQKYLDILRKYKKRFNFKLYCFCLMPNHVHLIIQVEDPMRLSKIMKCLNLSYTLYFNFKYEKVGHLWQDRFKSKLIEQDAHLLECINYIENNPVRASLVPRASDYPWSSHRTRGSKQDILDELFTI